MAMPYPLENVLIKPSVVVFMLVAVKKTLLLQSSYIPFWFKRWLAYSTVNKVCTAVATYSRGLSRSVMAGSGGDLGVKLKFINSAIRSLPLDKDKQNYVRTVQGACFSLVKPTPMKSPSLVGCSQSALSLLGIPPGVARTSEWVEFLCGNKLLPGSEPAAHCYCGHQFGHFAGQLGDGCAILLGEVERDSGRRWELQLKGSGKTPYSRTADGRKVLRSSIREFLCSEAMHHLGIPTTRAGTCITSEDYVTRDILYTGDEIQERATVITRIAPSFIRFGSFEIFKRRDLVSGRQGPSVGLTDLLHQLVDYVTLNFYPEIHAAHSEDRAARTADFFHEVCRRTARLVALWQSVGFCHGVLNTDNMSIMGITIDYGPFGFLDRFNPGHTCNGSDNTGRYAYDKQPSICRWNLTKLAEALSAGGLAQEKAKEGLEVYDCEFEAAYLSKMRQKLGLVHKELPEDVDLVESLLDTMHTTGCDFTNGFHMLSSVDIPGAHSHSDISLERQGMVDQCATPQELVKGFGPVMKLEQLEMMNAYPPQLLVALGFPPDALQTEFLKHKKLGRLKTMSAAEKLSDDSQTWESWLAKYRSRLSMEIESAEGKSPDEVRKGRLKVMAANNPRIVLRNHLAQKAIEMAEQGDYSEVEQLLNLLEAPYSGEVDLDRGSSTSAVSHEGTSVDTPSDCRSQDRRALLVDYLKRPPLEALDVRVT